MCAQNYTLKMKNMGVYGIALDWFASYLANWSQAEDINGEISDIIILDAISIIQGSNPHQHLYQ